MKKGFTLIELLVVVLIIGILAAVALPQYTKAVEKSRTAEAMTLMGDILTAERIYQMATGNFTGDLTALDIEMPGIQASKNTIHTKNFVISVVTPNSAAAGTAANGFVVKAVRSNAGSTAGTMTAATGTQGYTLAMGLNQAGAIARYCLDSGTGNICAVVPDWNKVTAETGFVKP